jgi:hypothetical protein
LSTLDPKSKAKNRQAQLDLMVDVVSSSPSAAAIVSAYEMALFYWADGSNRVEGPNWADASRKAPWTLDQQIVNGKELKAARDRVIEALNTPQRKTDRDMITTDLLDIGKEIAKLERLSGSVPQPTTTLRPATGK